jgi:hypothetical protein
MSSHTFLRTLAIAARFLLAFVPSVYLLLRLFTFPATPQGQNLAAMLTGWFLILCVALIAATHLAARRAAR